MAHDGAAKEAELIYLQCRTNRPLYDSMGIVEVV